MSRLRSTFELASSPGSDRTRRLSVTTTARVSTFGRTRVPETAACDPAGHGVVTGDEEGAIDAPVVGAVEGRTDGAWDWAPDPNTPGDAILGSRIEG
jgi:hypothetical protein